MTWAFEEDFIVCNFYLSHQDDWRKCMSEVMAELQAAGFGFRDKGTVRMRIQNFSFLHTGHGLSKVTAQIKKIYGALAQRMKQPAGFVGLQSFISNHLESADDDYGSVFTGAPQNASAFVPIDPVGPSFQETLFGFIDQRGMKDSDVYNSCYVDKGLFSHIRKGDRGVSKRTVKQLCFGLKLTYEEAVVLLKSAGYAFSNNSVADLVVVYFLKNKIYDIIAANIELYDRNEELLFSA